MLEFDPHSHTHVLEVGSWIFLSSSPHMQAHSPLESGFWNFTSLARARTGRACTWKVDSGFSRTPSMQAWPLLDLGFWIFLRETRSLHSAPRRSWKLDLGISEFDSHPARRGWNLDFGSPLVNLSARASTLGASGSWILEFQILAKTPGGRSGISEVGI